MALTAFLETLDILGDGSSHVVAIVTDNVSVKIRVDKILPINTTVEGLKAALSSVVTQAPNLDALKQLPLHSPLDLTPAPPDPPTPDQEAQRAFIVAYQGLQSGLRKVAAGVIAADDKGVAAQLALVQSLYLPDYLLLG
jgi:hypothetical protein